MRISFKILLALIVVVWISREIYMALSENRRDLSEIGVLSFGTVYKITGTGGRSAVFLEHTVLGKKYSNLMPATPFGLVLWEKYNILYDPDDPKHFKVLIDQPVFLSEENTAKSIATVIKVTTHSTIQPLIRFEYSVLDSNGEMILERSQYLPDSFLIEFPHLKEGTKFGVKYWVENPKRAIIDLNSCLR
jgi:hypothetical protein